MKAIQILGPKTSPVVTVNPAHPLPGPLLKTTHHNENNNPDTQEDSKDSITNTLLIRVHAAGLTADELSWPELYDNPTRIPGCEISGVIASLPSSSSASFTNPLNLKVNDPVYAMLPATHGSGQAEYVRARPGDVALLPGTRGPGQRSLITHAQAAALPIPVLTAWEGLFTHAVPLLAGSLQRRQALQIGERHKVRVLVTGASGAVGRMVVQLARRRLAEIEIEILALASPQHHPTLHRLGATHTIDYHNPNWPTTSHVSQGPNPNIDLVFDTASPQTLTQSWPTLRPDGVLLTISDPPPKWAFDKSVTPDEVAPGTGREGVRYVYFIVSPNGPVLGEVAGMLERGELEGVPVVEFGVDEGVEAWRWAGERGRGGKGVVVFA
ncbi:uncharacterized protein C8A04DRAFT_10996 [Dichotomopilus funicola]|uniref:Enoyl reductase (ER) domain-containing protein n=1 Tax=Dichotomopilus funicola TaxID=1934379 RepID=A0AAN6ZPY2_9PEZI|nr:hypothetical protein C8A04DRAFT_10996 [Dichotomopilus funicola]